jgi:SAM-dependent methyltransferase
LEFETTCTYLDRCLPETGRVLDAGGGPGRYAIWLADRGYEVVHCDLSAEQARIARNRVADRGFNGRVDHGQADVRDLPYETSTFDAVCCLGGPLSHVLDPAKRSRAIGELERVAASGAPVLVSVMGRIACLREIVQRWLPEEHGLLDSIAETGDYTHDLLAEHGDGEGWAECHFFRAAELEADLEAEGLTVERLVGLEGLASVAQEQLAQSPDEAVESVLATTEELREDPAVVDASEHMLAVCRA